MNLWCKDTTVCAINSTFSVDFYTFYRANVCTVCPIRLQFILKMFHCMTTPSGIIDILETNLRRDAPLSDCLYHKANLQQEVLILLRER